MNPVVHCRRRLILLIGAVLLWGCNAEPQGRPNIVLVVLDTVRADAFSSRVTPNLTDFARRATVFDNAWAVAPWTVPSHASIFTGVLPSEHGCTSQAPRLGAQPVTIAEKLSAAGYETAAFFSNPWLGTTGAGLLRGFQIEVETELSRFFAPRARYVNGDQGGRGSVQRVSDWLGQREKERPFFLFVNLLEAHLPYDPPAEIRNEFLGGINRHEWFPVAWAHRVNAGVLSPGSSERERATDLYSGDVHLADRLFGELRAVLSKQGVLHDSVVVVTSDHGENLGEHGLAEHQFSLHETLLKVPLVVRAPNRLEVGTRHGPVVLTDLYPTFLDLADVDAEAAGGPGISLFADRGTDRPLFAEYAGPPQGLLSLLCRYNPQFDETVMGAAYRSVRLGEHRLTISSTGRLDLHDLAQDPGQLEDVSETQPELVARLSKLVQERFPKDWPGRGAIQEMDVETRDRLEGLGYVVD